MFCPFRLDTANVHDRKAECKPECALNTGNQLRPECAIKNLAESIGKLVKKICETK